MIKAKSYLTAERYRKKRLPTDTHKSLCSRSITLWAMDRLYYHGDRLVVWEIGGRRFFMGSGGKP